MSGDNLGSSSATYSKLPQMQQAAKGWRFEARVTHVELTSTNDIRTPAQTRKGWDASAIHPDSVDLIEASLAVSEGGDWTPAAMSVR